MIQPEDNYENGIAVTQPRRSSIKLVDNYDEAPIDLEAGEEPAEDATMTTGQRKSGGRRARVNTRAVLLALLSAPPAAMATCLQLKGSKACSAFQSASVTTTDSYVLGLLYVNPT